MYLVQKNHLRSHSNGYETLKWLSHKCKNLYNTALYTIINQFKINGHFLSEGELFKEVQSHISYQELSPDNAQLTLRTLRQNYKGFFKLL